MRLIFSLAASTSSSMGTYGLHRTKSQLLIEWMCDCLSACDKIMLSIALSVVTRPCWPGHRLVSSSSCEIPTVMVGIWTLLWDSCARLLYKLLELWVHKRCNPTPFTAVEVGVPKPWKCTCAQASAQLVHSMCTSLNTPCILEMYTCLGTSWRGHVCISKQFPSLDTPNFTALVVKVGGDMGQDSETEVIHLGLNQPPVFSSVTFPTWKLGHIPTVPWEVKTRFQ